MPPAMRKAPSETPSTRKSTLPSAPKAASTIPAARAARKAIRRRCAAESARVIARSSGTAAGASTTRNSVASVDTAKERIRSTRSTIAARGRHRDGIRRALDLSHLSGQAFGLSPEATGTRLATAAGVFGTTTVSSPLFSSALTCSLSVCSGNVNVRVKLP